MTTTPIDTLKPLRGLLDIIVSSIASLQTSFIDANLRFPSLNTTFSAGVEEDFLATDDEVRRAILHIVAACEQLVSMIRTPMEVLCDAAMCYHLPACLSVLESGHIVEILDEAGIKGLHVQDIAKKMHVDIEPMILSRILRLLATHHIILEVTPDVFANNRISSFISTHKSLQSILSDPDAKYDATNGVAGFVGMCTQDIFKAAAYLPDSLGLSLHLKHAVVPDCISISPSNSVFINDNEGAHIRNKHSTSHIKKSNVDMPKKMKRAKTKSRTSAVRQEPRQISSHRLSSKKQTSPSPSPGSPISQASSRQCESDETEMSAIIEQSLQHTLAAELPSTAILNAPPAPKTAFNLAFRTSLPYFHYMEASHELLNTGTPPLLRRFGAAMQGSAAWEMKGIVAGFDWRSLMEPPKQIIRKNLTSDLPRIDLAENEVAQINETITIVDVGGGIGACCMALVRAFPEYSGAMQGLDKDLKRRWRFIVQDRQKVVKIARNVWEKEGLGDLVREGVISFVGHDFFTPQSALRLHSDKYYDNPPEAPFVFLLRAIAHDWPDEHVRVILTHLRNASSSSTILILGDHAIPYTCVDDSDWKDVEGGFRTLHDSPKDAEGASANLLLSNLGRGSSNAYWVDLCMQVMFGSQERTLGHIIKLTRSAGWEVSRVNMVGRSLFAYVVCRPSEDWK